MRAFIDHFTRVALWLVLATATALACGFLWFAGMIERSEPKAMPKTDAIVALTGGAQRLAAASELLSSGQAKRLLITGVHPATSRADIARTFADISPYMECCVELDYEAANTIGNALQTQQWMMRHRFTSLIVVTSTYHMPRTLLEFSALMPDIRIVAYPVISEAVQLDGWWAHPTTFRILVGEYAKYLAAWVRRAWTLTIATLPSPTHWACYRFLHQAVS